MQYDNKNTPEPWTIPLVEGTDPPEIKNTARLTIDNWNTYPGGTIAVDAVNVVGVTFNNDDGVSRQKILSYMVKYEEVYLEQEPDNPHDSKAIAVVGAMGKIGHIQKEKTPIFHQLLNAGFTPRVKFFGPLTSNDLKTLGAKLYVQFFPPDNCNVFSAKVVGITGKTDSGDPKKDIAEFLRPGDIVFFEGELNDNCDIVIELRDKNYDNFGKLGKKDVEAVSPFLDSAKYGQFGAVLKNDDSGLHVAVWFWDKTDKEREEEKANTIRVTIG